MADFSLSLQRRRATICIASRAGVLTCSAATKYWGWLPFSYFQHSLIHSQLDKTIKRIKAPVATVWAATEAAPRRRAPSVIPTPRCWERKSNLASIKFSATAQRFRQQTPIPSPPTDRPTHRQAEQAV